MTYADADTHYLSKRSTWPSGPTDWPDLIAWGPGLIVGRHTKIATMGSCFALHIGEWLDGHGYSLVAHHPVDGSGPWGKVYTPAAFDQLMRHAVGAWEPTLEPWIGPLGTPVDPYRKWVSYGRNYSYEALREDTRKVLADAEVFILTLGLTEAWYDGEDVLYQAPPENAFRANPHRYRLKVLDVDDVRGMLWNGILAARRVNPDLQFLLTVSPVPLTATFRDDCDVFTANLDSKHTLRLAAREMAGLVGPGGEDGVFYFPSYEMALAHPHPFREDSRHITPEFVSYVMSRFERAYTE